MLSPRPLPLAPHLLIALFFLALLAGCGPKAEVETPTTVEKKETIRSEPQLEVKPKPTVDKDLKGVEEDCDAEEPEADPFDLGQCPEPEDGYDPLLDEPIE